MSAKSLSRILLLAAAGMPIRVDGESARPPRPGITVTAPQAQPPGAFDYDFQFVCKLGVEGQVYKCHLLNPTGHAEFDRWAWDYCKRTYRDGLDATQTTYLILYYRTKPTKNE